MMKKFETIVWDICILAGLLMIGAIMGIGITWKQLSSRRNVEIVVNYHLPGTQRCEEHIYTDNLQKDHTWVFGLNSDSLIDVTVKLLQSH